MLSTTSEYALRAMAHLARQTNNHAVLGRDLARVAEIPANYLSKVLLTLRKAGLVDTSRGSGGGYRLHMAASEIYLIDVVQLFEEISRTSPTCFLKHTRPCSDSTPCSAHAAWRDLQAAYLGFLVSTSLASIAGEPDETWSTSEPRSETTLPAAN